MRVLGLVAALAILASLPHAAAQVPDPAEVVDQACAAVGGIEPQARDLLPVCPRADPAPAQPADPDTPPAAPAPVPGNPEEVPALAGEILDDIKKIPEDPGTSAERLASVVATVVQFVKDLLGVPGTMLDEAGDKVASADAAIGAAVSAAGDATKRAASAISDAAANVVASIQALFDAPAAAPATPSAPRAKLPQGLPEAGGLLGDVARALPVR